MSRDGALAEPADKLSDGAIAAAVAELYGFCGSVGDRFDGERDQTVLFADDLGTRRVVKVSHPSVSAADVDLEGAAAVWVRARDQTLPVAAPLRTLDGALYGRAAGRLVRLYEWLPGTVSRDGATLGPGAVKEFGATAARLGVALRGFFHPAAGRRLLWHIEARHSVAEMAEAVTDPADRGLVRGALDRFEHSVAPLWETLRAQTVHSDLTLDNVLLDDADRICGIIDFGDLTHTALVADIAEAMATVGATRTGADLWSTLALFLDGYTAVSPLEPVERAVLADTVALRMAITLVLSEAEADPDAENFEYLRSWNDAARNILGELDGATAGDLAEAFGAPPPRQRSASLLARRTAVFGSVLAPLTYSEPLMPVRGCGAALFDTDGREYVDAYNNVPVVGHAHPRVAGAIADQTRLLSTNLRYLHPAAIELAERLVATMPAASGLDTVLFLNSGSEAVDLAWRIATAATAGTGALVTDFAYHGVTTATTALSPEQWRGGSAPDHVERFTVGAPLDGALDRLAARGHRPAAVFVDPTYTSDGILVPSRQYHAALTAAARQRGAMVVADEVQAGFGRCGDHLWSFVGAGLTPDIVTLGKPMGNGHPVAAVIARRSDVETLAGQTEFFSTYAGGPVAAVAGKAVLDVISGEHLVSHAAEMGERLRNRLSACGLSARGRGMLIGLEVADAACADAVLDRARRDGVLIGSTGPQSNVLKIRPPLVITPEQVDRVATVVTHAIEETTEQVQNR